MEIVWSKAIYAMNGLKSSRNMNLTWRLKPSCCKPQELTNDDLQALLDDKPAESMSEFAEKLVRHLKNIWKIKKIIE